MSETMIRNLFAAGFGLLAGAVAFLVIQLPHLAPEFPEEGNPAYAPQDWPKLPEEGAEEDLDGAGLYAANCAACHQESGTGQPPAFPPLAGSEWVTGDPETPIRIASLGLSGPITVKGEQYNSAMPKLPLDPEQIAKIVSHIRTSWGNEAGEVTVEQVKAVQESIGDRTEAWTAEELKQLQGQ